MSQDLSYLDFDRAPCPARTRLPAGACDTHFHVFEDPARYPLAEPRSYTPTLATLADYRRMAQAIGIDRAVLVHPSPYGRDHATFEATLAACADWMRGVAVVYPDTPEPAIERWDRLGARGTRCNALFAGGVSYADLAEIAARVRGLGWHLQLLVDVSADASLVARVCDLGLPVVVDHFGHVPAARALADAGFANLRALVREGRAWVKLSGPYRFAFGAERYGAVRPLAEALLADNPAQLLWGSDWPHPSIAAPMPNDGELADLLFEWLTPSQRQQVLVDNPTRLYWAR